MNDNSLESIIIFENCVPGYDTLTVDSIYEYYDSLVDYVTLLRRLYPNSIIIWSKPTIPSGYDVSTNIRVLHQYLILKHLIHDNGILVIQPDMIKSSRFTTTSATTSQKIHEAMKYQLQYMNISSKESIRQLSSKLNTYTSSMKLETICNPLINTRKHDDRCFPYPDQLYPLLITGLGGSGTHEIANRLRGRGVRVRHEEIDTDGTVSWFHAVNNDYESSSPYPHHAALHNSNYFSPRFSKVIHVVRCPLKQISSFTTHLHESYSFVYDHMILMKRAWSSYMKSEDHRMKSFITTSHCDRGSKCNLHFSALSWLFWNNHVHKYADVTYHTEDMNDIITYVCSNITTCSSTTTTSRSVNNTTLLTSSIRKIRTILGLRNNRDIVSSSHHHHHHHEYDMQQLAMEAGTNIAAHVYGNGKMYGYTKKDC